MLWLDNPDGDKRCDPEVKGILWMRKRCCPGNTLAEYGLIGILVVVVALVALSGTGGNLALWMSGLKGDMQSHINQSRQALASDPGNQPVSQATHVQTVSAGNQNAASASLNAPISVVGSLAPYNPAQTVGANGINLVDQYAERINQLADQLQGSPNVDGDFIEMLRDLAMDGHNVAADERSVLTYTQASDGGFNFSIQTRYEATKARALDYLNVHPAQLSAEDAQLLNLASSNITQQMTDFMGGSDPSSLSGLNINQKFTDAGGSGQGATYVDTQASKICSLATPCQ
jgi:hypothetical protein